MQKRRSGGTGDWPTLNALRMVLTKRKYVAIAIGSAAALLLVYLVSFAMIVFKSFDARADPMMVQALVSGSVVQAALMGVLAMLFGVWVSLQWYVRQEKKAEKSSSAVAAGSVFGGFLGGIGSLGSCPACLAVISLVIGSAATTVLFDYKTPILAVGIVLIAISLSVTSKSIGNQCGRCK